LVCAAQIPFSPRAGRDVSDEENANVVLAALEDWTDNGLKEVKV
jgi:hypothetical protein